jgi:Na+/proline symporter
MSTIVSAFVDIPVEVAVVVCLGVAWCYSFLGGMWGVAVTDVIQFVITLAASVIFAVLALAETGGTTGLVESLQASGNGHLLDFFPSPASPGSAWPAFLVFLSVMWWATHDADGGGYVIQRMMSAKNERHAYLGTLWFAVAHYVLRLWPWILIALVSVVVLPGLSDHRAAYPELLARILPAGLKGLCLASFLAAYMSTIDTHLNWGAAYLINDLYKRFVRPEASERHYVLVSRLASLVLVVVGGAIALSIERITAAWEFVWAMGAGLGPVIVLRWFWWRINAWSEISALAASLTIAIGLLIHGAVSGEPLAFHIRALVVVAGSVVTWTLVTFLTRPEPREVLQRFCERVRPFGAWPFEYERSRAGGRALLLAWAGGVAMLYGGMFFLGNLLLGGTFDTIWTAGLALLGGIGLAVGLRKVTS